MRYPLPLAFAFTVALTLTGCEGDEDRYALENPDIEDVEPSDVPMASRDWPELHHWDVDGDDRLDRGELERGIASPDYFGRWDADGDGQLTEDEYHRGLFDRWKGDDEVIARDEYRAAVGAWFPDVDWEFMAFDGNSDGFVDPVEFDRTMQRTDTFASLDEDGDGNVGQRELAAGMLQRLDDDGDGLVSRSEWRLG